MMRVEKYLLRSEINFLLVSDITCAIMDTAIRKLQHKHYDKIND